MSTIASKRWKKAIRIVKFRNLAVQSFKSVPIGIDSDTYFSPAIPHEVKISVPLLYGMTIEDIQKCLRVVVQILHGRTLSETEFRVLQLQELGFEGPDFGVVFTGLYSIVKTAVRNRTKLSAVRSTLREMNCPDTHIDEIVHCIRANRFELEDSAISCRVRFPSVAKFRWRTDVLVSTSALSKVLRPILLVQFILSTGKIVTFEMSVDQFHALRYSVAKVLRDMQNLERHPIMRIALEADKKEFDEHKKESKSDDKRLGK